jgi:hypothetical protein
MMLRLCKKGLVSPMHIKIIASLILLASAGASLQAQPAPSVTRPGASAASAELDKRKAHVAAIESCEAMWDSATHMTKTEWSRACQRVQNRLRQLELR